jgi:hypothetical protein
MLQRHQGRHEPAIGNRHEMDGLGVELTKKGGQIGSMGRCRIVLPVVGPCGGAMIAIRVGNEAVLLRYGLALWFPEAEVGEGAVHKHDGSPCPLVKLGEIDAIDTELTRLRGVSGPGWHSEGTTEPYDNCQR